MLSFGAKIEKIGPLDPETIGLQAIIKKRSNKCISDGLMHVAAWQRRTP